MIVHSILQGGPGFPVFSLAVYHYLAKGDVQETVRSMTVGNCSMQMKDLILKLRENSTCIFCTSYCHVFGTQQ